MSIYRKKGSKVYWCDFSYLGSRVRESTHQTSRILAEKYQRKRHLELETGVAGLRKHDIPPFFKEAAEQWFEQKSESGKWSASMEKIARRALDSHILPALGQKLFIELSAGSLNKYVKDRREAGAAIGSIGIELRAVRAILRSYGLWERIRREPHAPRISEGAECGRAISAEEERLLLYECSQSRSRLLLPFVTLALETGMRFGTIRMLRWDDVDFIGRSLRVGRDKTRAGSNRIIPLNRRAFETLRFLAERFPTRLPEHYVFPSESVGAGTNAFTAKCYDTNPTEPVKRVKSAWEQAKKRTRRHCPHCDGTLADNPQGEEGFTCTGCKAKFSELPPGVICRMHDLRHSACTRMLDSGISLSKVARILGWSQGTAVKMAARYSHFTLDDLRGAMETITKTGPEIVVFGETYPPFPPPFESAKNGGAN